MKTQMLQKIRQRRLREFARNWMQSWPRQARCRQWRIARVHAVGAGWARRLSACTIVQLARPSDLGDRVDVIIYPGERVVTTMPEAERYVRCCEENARNPEIRSIADRLIEIAQEGRSGAVEYSRAAKLLVCLPWCSAEILARALAGPMQGDREIEELLRRIRELPWNTYAFWMRYRKL